MDFKNLLNATIEGEISKIEQTGETVRLKSVTRQRIICTIISAIIFSFGLISGLFGISFITLVVYFIIMYNINNASVITKIAKKQPDTPIADIIRNDMK